jgi:AraC-like DNA-binding protein
MICGECGISSSHCNRMFKEWLETTPMEYLATQRMNYALLLLEETHLSIKEITFACGYSDPLYFSSQFRKRIGCSPRAFRKRKGI